MVVVNALVFALVCSVVMSEKLKWLAGDPRLIIVFSFICLSGQNNRTVIYCECNVVFTAPLFVLSAMKMEMVIDSPISGTVKKIYAQPKTKCAAGDLVIEIEPAAVN
jgi:hypothetical protein